MKRLYKGLIAALVCMIVLSTVVISEIKIIDEYDTIKNIAEILSLKEFTNKVKEQNSELQ